MPRLEFGGAIAFPRTSDEFTKPEKVRRAIPYLTLGLQRLSYEDKLQLISLFPEAYLYARKDTIYVRHTILGELGSEP